MKKVFSILAVAAFVCLVATSCSKDSPSGSGTAIYSPGLSSFDGDPTVAYRIAEIYSQKFNSISGATFSGSTITIEGKFSESDSKVLNACKAAESEANQVKLEGLKYATYHVRASYIGTDKVNDNFYSKTYGKKQ
ncbi:MAG: hypothetical protein KBS73_01390 [Bacteroidales bacterium]|nr:hypothetical protein [Candidatus Cacconaster equifaecalis]